MNKEIGEAAPNEYFATAFRQCETKAIEIGNISDFTMLKNNMAENAIPESIVNMTVDNYEDFLVQRRRLMAKMIERYYKGL